MHRPTLEFHLVSHLTTAAHVWRFKILLVLPLHPTPGPYPFACDTYFNSQPVAFVNRCTGWSGSATAPLRSPSHLSPPPSPAAPHTNHTGFLQKLTFPRPRCRSLFSFVPPQSHHLVVFSSVLKVLLFLTDFFCLLIAQTFLHLSCAGSNTWPASPDLIQCTSSFFAKSFLEASFPSHNGDIYSIVLVQSLSYFYN